MPVYEYMCPKCGTLIERFVISHKKKPQQIPCTECDEMATSIMSCFNTSSSMFKKLTGVDDTDDFTLGKLVANKGVPAEFKRKLRERITKYNKNRELYNRRKELFKFKEDGTSTE